MSLPRSTLPKALGLSILVISTALLGSQIIGDDDFWPDDLPLIDIYEWAENNTMSSKHLYAYIEQGGSLWQQGIMSNNASRLALFYNVSNTLDWYLNTHYTHSFNVSGYTDVDYESYKPHDKNITTIMGTLKPTIKELSFTQKIIVDHKQDERGIDTINLFIQEQSGEKYSTTPHLEIMVVTEDSITINMKIFDFGIIMTTSWMYYQIYDGEERSDAKPADQDLVNFLYFEESVNSQDYDFSVAQFPPNYYYFVEMPSFENGMQIEYIQAWNDLITAL